MYMNEVNCPEIYIHYLVGLLLYYKETSLQNGLYLAVEKTNFSTARKTNHRTFNDSYPSHQDR